VLDETLSTGLQDDQFNVVGADNASLHLSNDFPRKGVRFQFDVLWDGGHDLVEVAVLHEDKPISLIDKITKES
jgi:hypothetical protein